MTSNKVSDMTPAMASDMVSHMNKLYDEYKRLEDAAQTLIREMMESFSEGKVPDQDTSDNLDKTMDALKEQYNKIYAAAGEYLSAAERPRAGSLAEDYVIAVRNSKPVLIENRKQIAKIWLKRFIRTISYFDVYVTALAPCKKKASKQLASIDSLTELLNIEKLTTGPRFFFEALQRDDIASYSYSNLMDILREYYPERVLLGIVGKKYFDPEEDREEEEKELKELGDDPSFKIKDDILMEYDAADERELVVIPPWIRVIGSNAFSRSKCRHIFIPNSVQEIQYSAFYDSCIDSIVIPDSVTELGSSAFAQCDLLKSAVIGKGVTRIGDRAFHYCHHMDHLELPSGLKSVGSNAFEKCYSLKKIWVGSWQYRLSDPTAPLPVRLVYDDLERIRDRIRSDYENGLMDEFEYTDYNIGGDGYSY